MDGGRTSELQTCIVTFSTRCVAFTFFFLFLFLFIVKLIESFFGTILECHLDVCDVLVFAVQQLRGDVFVSIYVHLAVQLAFYVAAGYQHGR